MEAASDASTPAKGNSDRRVSWIAAAAVSTSVSDEDAATNGKAHAAAAHDDHHDAHGHHEPSSKFWKAMHFAQANALPLLSGIVGALIWANVDPVSYEHVLGHDGFGIFGEEGKLFDKTVSIHYVINDMFMVLFFGIAAKEVTESCLPGGSLNPPRKALAPLVATLGGVFGPILVFWITTRLCYLGGAFEGYVSWVPAADGGNGTNSSSSSSIGGGHHHRLLASASAPTGAGSYEQIEYPQIFNGWGIPTATDISLAWMVAVQVFPLRHPAIDFLLLLAVADDAIGLVIIAVFYPDPVFEAEPIFLLLCLGAIAISLILRMCLRLQHWAWYVLLAGVPSWIGLAKARLHPALALVFVVPLMPGAPPKSKPKQLPTLHAFEHALKAPVDFGLFFFTLANAGVSLSGGGGPMTLSIVMALVVGKLVGVTFLVLTLSKLNVAPLNTQIRDIDVSMVAGMASVGLTVALFVAGVAFRNDPMLQGEAKFGALLSGLMGFVCVGLSKLPCFKRKRKPAADGSLPPASPPRAGVTNSKLVGVGVMQGVSMGREDSYVMSDEPAAATLGYRQPAYYKHAIRAGDNRLPHHFDQLEHPSLFAVDPEASMRARSRWQLAKISSIVPMDALTDEQRKQRSTRQIIGFLQKSSSQSKDIAGADAGAAAASSSSSSSSSAAAGGEPADPVRPFVEDAPSEAPVPAAAVVAVAQAPADAVLPAEGSEAP